MHHILHNHKSQTLTNSQEKSKNAYVAVRKDRANASGYPGDPAVPCPPPGASSMSQMETHAVHHTHTQMLCRLSAAHSSESLV